MAKSLYIQSVIDAAKGRPKSTAWYRDKIKEFGQPGAMDLIRDGDKIKHHSMVNSICFSMTLNIEQHYHTMTRFL